MILIKNRQHKIPINIKLLQHALERMLAHLDYKDFDIGILLTTNKSIRAYNKKFRHKDKPTDILSFPFYPNLKPGKKIIAQNPDDKNLGDIIISLEYAQQDANKNWNRSLAEHLVILLAHGISHLIGYDHQTDAQDTNMKKQEKTLLQSVSHAKN